MDQLKEKVTKIEWRVDKHDEEIRLLHSASDELRTTLNSITKNQEVVLPPYFTVPGPGHGMLPRVPHSLSENVDELGIT